MKLSALALVLLCLLSVDTIHAAEDVGEVDDDEFASLLGELDAADDEADDEKDERGNQDDEDDESPKKKKKASKSNQNDDENEDEGSANKKSHSKRHPPCTAHSDCKKEKHFCTEEKECDKCEECHNDHDAIDKQCPTYCSDVDKSEDKERANNAPKEDEDDKPKVCHVCYPSQLLLTIIAGWEWREQR